MKQQILEVQKYFVQKIQNREYTLLNSEMQVDGWLRADLDIEDFKFEISCKNEILCTHVTPIQFTREQKELINESLQYLKKDFREKSIQLLKDKIAELESQN